jgi:hypothetical protein
VPAGLATALVRAIDVITIKAQVADNIIQSPLLQHPDVSIQFVRQEYFRVVDLNVLDVLVVLVMLTDLT